MRHLATNLLLVLFLAATPAPVPAGQDVDELIAKLTAQAETSHHGAGELQLAYARLLDKLMPGLSADDLAHRTATRRTLESVCLNAGRPGAEQERECLCLAIVVRLGPTTPHDARVWLLQQVQHLGRHESVPALTLLLEERNPRIRELARQALQINSAQGAAIALRRALDKTKPTQERVAIVNAIGARRDPAAVTQLIEIMTGKDQALAAAAAEALGDIGTTRAIQALEVLRHGGSEPARTSAATALIRIADDLLNTGQRQHADDVYSALLENSEPTVVRMAALRGLAGARQMQALPVLLSVLADDDNSYGMRAVAAQATENIPGTAATATLTAMLEFLSPAGQVLLIDALEQRADLTAQPALLKMLDSPNTKVRVATLRALTKLGDDGAVTRLSQIAAGTAGDEQDAARRVLARLRGPRIEQTMLALIPSRSPEVRVELIRALAARNYRHTAPMLLDQAHDKDARVRIAALEALRDLADQSTAEALVDLLLTSEAGRVRQAAENAVVATCLRSSDSNRTVAPLLASWENASPGARVILIGALGRVGGPEALDLIRGAHASGEDALVNAAVRALAQSNDVGVLPDLRDIAQHSDKQAHRVLALRGLVRLLGLPNERAPQHSFELYTTALALAQRPEEQRLVLCGLAVVAHPEALRTAQELRATPGLQPEAELAIVSIARLIHMRNHQLAASAVEAVLDQPANEIVAEQAREALDDILAAAGCLVDWEVAGPYFADDQDWEYVFDRPFAPELQVSDVRWQPLPTTNDERPWIFDLSQYDRGNDRCAYFRATVNAASDRPARLEIGSDDGVKVWLNGTLVHENRATRSHTPLEDRVPVELIAGENSLLVKVVQAQGGWGFSAAIRPPE